MAKYIAQNISIRGYSHKLSDIECQDHSISWSGGEYVAAIVCDGHGGAKYIRSSVGSRTACCVGKKLISEFMRGLRSSKELNRKFSSSVDEREKMLSQLTRAIIQEWNKCVLEDSKSTPLSCDSKFELLTDDERQDILNEPTKAYGSTFVAAIMREDFYIILKLGDGNVCLVRGGSNVDFAEKYSPELKDDSLQFNLTTSLCSAHADVDFRYAFRTFDPRELHGIVLTSDGVINSYTNEESFLSLIRNIYLSFSSREEDNAETELRDFLATLSQRGSGDDLSVAILCRKRKS